jgi:co-chaperonin GroES (HSP10)
MTANPSGITPLEFKVLVKPSDAEVDPVLARAKAQGLQLPPDVLEREFAAQIVATFIAKGGNAFEDWRDDKLPAPGDTILIAKYAGITVKRRRRRRVPDAERQRHQRPHNLRRS